MLPQTVATLFRAISAETRFYNCSKERVGNQLGRERIFDLSRLYYVRDYRKTLRIIQTSIRFEGRISYYNSRGVLEKLLNKNHLRRARETPH